MKAKILVLDFDGVIADSCLDGFLISYGPFLNEFKQKVGKFYMKEFKALNSKSPHLIRKFRQLRPFLMYGGDYMLIHWAIDSNQAITSQKAFDLLRKKFDHKIDGWGKIFHDNRQDIIANEFEDWINLNKIYPGVKEIFAANRIIYLASANEIKNIQKILEYNYIGFPDDHIFDCNSAKYKPDIMKMIMDRENARPEQLFFIDDQIENLKLAQCLGVKVGLATWGYCTDKHKKEAEKLGIVKMTRKNLQDL